MDRWDVVVVGGGPAGASAATLLKLRGHDVLLLDEARFPRDKVCGEGISPEAWRLLGEFGAADVVRALAPRPLTGMRLVAPDGTVFAGHYGGGRQGLALRRSAFDAALLAVARRAGVEVREGTRVTDLLGREQGAARGVRHGVPDRDDTEVHARLVVVADGRRSRLARQLGLLTEHRTFRKFAVRGHWAGMEGLTDKGEMHVGGGGYCGIAPLPGGEANVALVLGHAAVRAAGGDLEGFYRSALGRWPSIAERLQRAVLLEPPRAIGPLALEARRVSAPGALLAGDAAGFYDPFTGEGVTLALRSAEILAAAADRALRSARSAAPLDLREYDRRRDEATRDKFRLNRLIQRVVAWPEAANLLARKLRRRPALADRLVGIAGDFVPARTAFDVRFVYDLLTA
jgi:geranylgeranyl reductase family protein